MRCISEPIPYRLNPTHSGRLPAELSGHSMRHSPICVGFIFLLTVLLGVQLTGLPCVDDTATTRVAMLSAQDTASTVGQQGHTIDACPCHSHFVSIRWNFPQPYYMATPFALNISPL